MPLKKLLLIPIFLLPFSALAITGQEARFDFTNGQPAITADATDPCTDTAKVRFDFTQGQPTEVYDSTANCTLAASTAENTYLVSIPTSYRVVIPSNYLMIVQ